MAEWTSKKFPYLYQGGTNYFNTFKIGTSVLYKYLRFFLDNTTQPTNFVVKQLLPSEQTKNKNNTKFIYFNFI